MGEKFNSRDLKIMREAEVLGIVERLRNDFGANVDGETQISVLIRARSNKTGIVSVKSGEEDKNPEWTAALQKLDKGDVMFITKLLNSVILEGRKDARQVTEKSFHVVSDLRDTNKHHIPENMMGVGDLGYKVLTTLFKPL